jgi:hypothetical protein
MLNEMEQSYPIGSITTVNRNDGVFRARVIEKRKLLNNYQLYVHYLSFDRRHDEWVDITQMRTDLALTAPTEKEREKWIKFVDPVCNELEIERQHITRTVFTFFYSRGLLKWYNLELIVIFL